jgi:hypothetical protein
MDFTTALLVLGGVGLLSVGILVAFFLLRKTIKTTKSCLVLSLLAAAGFVILMIVAAVFSAGR